MPLKPGHIVGVSKWNHDVFIARELLMAAESARPLVVHVFGPSTASTFARS
jgi:hypothetical protein